MGGISPEIMNFQYDTVKQTMRPSGNVQQFWETCVSEIWDTDLQLSVNMVVDAPTSPAPKKEEEKKGNRLEAEGTFLLLWGQH